MASALMDLADAACADARAAVARGHKAVGTGRMEVAVNGQSLEIRLAQWRLKDTATLAEPEVAELIDTLTSKLAVLRAAVKLAKAESFDHESLA